MPARTRTYQSPPLKGGRRFRKLFGTWQNQPYPIAPFTFKHVCSDVTGNRDGSNGLTIDKEQYGILPLNGFDSDQNEYQGWYPAGMMVLPAHMATAAPSTNELINMLVTRSNPGRAEVSIPRAVAELRELPSLVRQGGDLYRRYFQSPMRRRDRDRLRHGLQAANDGQGIYLAYEFGVAPIISDMHKLLDFQARFDRRAKELARFFSNGGSKRRLQLGNYSATDTVDNVPVVSGAGGTWYARRTRTTRVDCWGTIRWRPAAGVAIPQTHAQLMHQARRAVLGLGPTQLGDAWDIIPFSWMVDWFADVGNFLHTWNNRIPATMSNICVMRRSTTKFEFERLDHKEVKGGSGYTMRVTKTRHVGSSQAPITLNNNFMSTWRLSIVSALAATRHRRVAR